MPSDGGPACERRSLQMEEEEDPAKEAFDATACASLLCGPRGRHTGAMVLACGIPGNHRNGTDSDVNPEQERQSPRGGISAKKARADLRHMHGPCQEWLRKGSIMDSGRGKEKQEWDT